MLTDPRLEAVPSVCPPTALPDSLLGGEALELTILMPCLDEARTVGACVEEALAFLRENGVRGEVLVVDNGSADGSVEVAENSGARVVRAAKRGYGAALAHGIAVARGRFVIMGDADQSYDLYHLASFLERLRAGDELVMGNRFRGGIQRGAMPLLHRVLGNPFLTAVGRRFFGSSCHDFYCGLRGFDRRAVERLGLTTTGMEFALEMLVKASLSGLRVSEVPTVLRRDGRDRRPHLRTWRDGWRSLRFLLLYSPRWLFLYPGLALMLAGLLVGAWILPHGRQIGGVALDVHTLLYCAVAVSLGFQLVVFSLFSKVIAVVAGLHPPSGRAERILHALRLEVGLAAGAALLVAGLGGSLFATLRWANDNFGDLDPFHVMRITIPSTLLLTLGAQIVFWSFYLSLLRIQWSQRFAARPLER